MKKIVLYGMILIAFLLSACQPTPEKVAVPGESSSNPIETIALGEMASGLPKNVKKQEAVRQGLLICYDAEVIADFSEVKEATAEKAVFTAIQVDELTHTLAGEYSAWEVTPLTKTDYIKRLTDFEKVATEAEWDTVTLDYLHRMIEEAPDPKDVEKRPYDLYAVKEDDRINMDIMAPSGNGRVLAKENSFYYYRDMARSCMPSSDIDESCAFVAEKPSFTQEEAIGEVNQLLQNLSLENVFVVLPTYTEECCFYWDSRPLDYGYKVYAVRKAGSLLGDKMGDSMWAIDHAPSIVAPWPMETMEFAVDSQGIAVFCWGNRITLEPAEEEVSQCMPFEAILERATNLLGYQLGVDESRQGNRDDVITVTEIRLMHGVLQVRDKLGTGRDELIWKFGYTHTNEYAGIVEESAVYLRAKDGVNVNPRITPAEYGG